MLLDFTTRPRLWFSLACFLGAACSNKGFSAVGTNIEDPDATAIQDDGTEDRDAAAGFDDEAPTQPPDDEGPTQPDDDAVPDPIDGGPVSLCLDRCSMKGAMGCSGGVLSVCQAGKDGCLQWVETQCASGFCANATECGSCDDQCSAEGVTECTAGALRTCVVGDQGCLIWSKATACRSGTCEDRATCAAPMCDGSPGAWQGCRGSGCSVCTETTELYPFYFTNNPSCTKNDRCDGLFFECSASCPEPTDADKAPLAGTCDGSVGQWDGCRGNGCLACTDALVNYPKYFANNPRCVPNPNCEGRHGTCNDNCPAPTAKDK